MDTDTDTQSYFTLHERLVISALIAGASLWLRVVEVTPDRRRRARPERP